MHRIEQRFHQGRVALLLRRQPELAAHSMQRQLGEARGEFRDGGGGEFHRPARIRIDDRQQGFRKPREIPQAGVRLIAVGIAAAVVDRAEHRRRIVGIHECAWTEIDGLARHGHVVGIHDAVNEAHLHPARDQRGLSIDHRAQQREIRLFAALRLRVVAIDGIVREQPNRFDIVACGVILECAHADMARRHPDRRSSECAAPSSG